MFSLENNSVAVEFGNENAGMRTMKKYKESSRTLQNS